MYRVTQGTSRRQFVFGYGAITLCSGTFQILTLTNYLPHQGPTTPVNRFRLIRFRSPLLTESRSLSFPRLTEMFHFRRCRSSLRYGTRPWVIPFGNPRIKARHSSPRLIAVDCVLHRRLAPRHPLYALNIYLMLIYSYQITKN